jgi:hypothetical protein
MLHSKTLYLVTLAINFFISGLNGVPTSQSAIDSVVFKRQVDVAVGSGRGTGTDVSVGAGSRRGAGADVSVGAGSRRGAGADVSVGAGTRRGADVDVDVGASGVQVGVDASNRQKSSSKNSSTKSKPTSADDSDEEGNPQKPKNDDDEDSDTSDDDDSSKDDDDSGSGSKDMKKCLELHNKKRKSDKNVKAPAMTWDPKLAAEAKKWASKIASKKKLDHDKSIKSKNVGENLAMGDGSCNSAVKMWYDEIKDYKPKMDISANLMKVGHYTQLMWKSSKKLGCGASGKYVVCRYSPAGNMKGKTLEKS